MDQAARRATADLQAEFRPMAVLQVVVGRADAVAIAIAAEVHVVRQVTMARAVRLASPVAPADAQGSTTDRQLLSLHANTLGTNPRKWIRFRGTHPPIDFDDQSLDGTTPRFEVRNLKSE